jgi:hypothetical protein
MRVTKWSVRTSNISLSGNHVTHGERRFDSQVEAQAFADHVIAQANPNLRVYSVGVDHNRSY